MVFFDFRNPFSCPSMIQMIGPAPSQKHIHIKEILHGNSASISRTDPVVSGCAIATGAKISAPVKRHRTFSTLLRVPLPVARCRRNSEMLIFSLRAVSRMIRASSSVTSKIIVLIRQYGEGGFQLILFYKDPCPSVLNHSQEDP